MPGREADRTKHRTTCTLILDGQRHSGFLLDYSRSGIFVQTNAKLRVGRRLDVELTLRGERLAMHVEVARARSVPVQLRSVVRGGVGLMILRAPDAYYERVAADGQGRGDDVEREPQTPQPADERETPPSGAGAAAGRYRVRARASQGNRSRTLDIEGATEADASRRASEELGEGWEILEVAPIRGR